MGTITGARLKEGEDKRFEQVGLRLGTASVQSRQYVEYGTVVFNANA